VTKAGCSIRGFDVVGLGVVLLVDDELVVACVHVAVMFMAICWLTHLTLSNLRRQ